LAQNCVDADVTTLEGLRADQTLGALQDAFEEHGALQCGFCTPGMLVAAQALIASHAEPTVEDVQRALSGNLCRCTGYKKITKAVIAAARTLRGKR